MIDPRARPPDTSSHVSGSGWLDRDALAAACVALDLPRGDADVDALARAMLGADLEPMDFRAFASYARTKRRRVRTVPNEPAGPSTRSPAYSSARAWLAAGMPRGAVPAEASRASSSAEASRASSSASATSSSSSTSRSACASSHHASLSRLIAGGVAGVAARTATAPLDRARTIAQDLGRGARSAAKAGLPKRRRASRPRGAFAICAKVVREEGFGGLWRGNAVTALKIIPSQALQFAIFHHAKDWFRVSAGEERDASASARDDVSTLERLASGSLAGAVATAACYPLDTLKSQMSVRGGLRGGAVRAAAQIFREQGGARAFYKGIGPTLVADVIGTGLGFTLYDTFVNWYRSANGGRAPNPLEKGALGGLGACACLTATQPLEVVMTRMRVQGVGGRPVLYRSAMDCLRKSVEREGLRSLWLGTGAAYVKIFPQLAITYGVFELVCDHLGCGEEGAAGDRGGGREAEAEKERCDA